MRIIMCRVYILALKPWYEDCKSDLGGEECKFCKEGVICLTEERPIDDKAPCEWEVDRTRAGVVVRIIIRDSAEPLVPEFKATKEMVEILEKRGGLEIYFIDRTGNEYKYVAKINSVDIRSIRRELGL